MLFFNLMKGEKEVKRMSDAYNVQIKKAMKVGIIEALRQVTISTPVDTGRARWSWFLSVKVPSPELPPEGKYRVPQTTERIKALEQNFTISDTLYLTNNVPYVPYLNEGSSKQAPARFVEKSAEIAQRAVLKWLRQKNTYSKSESDSING